MLGRGRPTASLFVQLLSFTVFTLLASHAISLYLIFALPPPVPDMYRVSEVEQVLRAGAPPRAAQDDDRPPLRIRLTAVRPDSDIALRSTPQIRMRMARALQVSPDRVAISGYAGPFFDLRVIRALRSRMAKQGGGEEQFLVAPFQVGVLQPDGRWRVAEPQPAFGLTPWQQVVAVWYLLSCVAMAPLAYVLARRLSAPTRLLAKAAERLGRDPHAPALAVRGSSEIAVAAKAFNDMQDRLRRYVEGRTAMVGAVAHDLRTPLTRLRFRIEAAPEELRAKLAADIEQMEAMIAATMAFVRDESLPVVRTRLELCSLVESVCDEIAETGASASFTPGECRAVLQGDPSSLRRLFTNLIENAVKFGDSARARCYCEADFAVVEIDDDGPGIPSTEMDRVFEPFYRREPSRSRATGGIGLGLAVVRSVARAHGGDVALMNRRDGGLTARVQLPL